MHKLLFLLIFFQSLLGLAASGLMQTAAAQASTAAAAWPTRPLRLVVPFNAGLTDTFGRVFAQFLGERLGQTVIVENRAGGGGVVGANAVARAPADGYTLLLASTSTWGQTAAEMRRLPYDPERDFTPVAALARGGNVIVVHPSVKASTLAELMTYARANPGRVRYCSAGIGSNAHFVGVLLAHRQRVELQHVPYKGGGPALSDVLAGHVKVLFAPAVSSMQHIQSGRLRAIAITGDKRLSSLPNVPTIAEAAVPGYESTVWYAVLAPPNTPREIVNRINTELSQILKDPAFKSMMNVNGIEPLGTTPEALNSHINKEMSKWSKVIKNAGLKAE
jgi:tripartite-type tricarboxylate transporter receptor subunit TctC